LTAGLPQELLAVIVGLSAFESIVRSQDAVSLRVFHPQLSGEAGSI
jgi:hypothetical protein